MNNHERYVITVYTTAAPEPAAHSAAGVTTATVLVEVVLTMTLLGRVDNTM